MIILACVVAGIFAEPTQQVAIQRYIERVIAKGAAWSNNMTTRKLPSVEHALACLSQTTPGLKLEYPADAEEHFEQIRRSMAPWAQHAAHKRAKSTTARFSGPWLENTWIRTFETLYDNRQERQGLRDFFGPFIPIFVPFNDHWKNNKIDRYPMLPTLRAILRPNVPYITVSHNDEGLSGRAGWPLVSSPNLLVLSSGGYGHVPLPLFLFNEKVILRKRRRRQLLVSYVGSSTHAPNNMREQMIAIVRHVSEQLNFSAFCGRLPRWRDVMANSYVSLCPRGFGRTSYHVMETVQMGLLPLHVYIDHEWLPYSKVFHSFGFACNLHGLPGMLARIHSMGVDELERRETIARGLRESHFSHAGTVAHIAGFMRGEASDLECRALPSSTN